MQEIQYKGFTIFWLVAPDMSKRFYIEGAEWAKAVGYPTLNHAKGAITNFLKTQVTDAKADFAIRMVDVANHLEHVVAHHAIVATEPVERIVPSRNKREGKYAGKGWGKHYRSGSQPYGTPGKAALRTWAFL